MIRVASSARGSEYACAPESIGYTTPPTMASAADSAVVSSIPSARIRVLTPSCSGSLNPARSLTEGPRAPCPRRSRSAVWPSRAPSLELPRVCAPTPPSRGCARRTLADDPEWREISGLGTLHSYTVACRPLGPNLAAGVPRLRAIVEWDEGPGFSTEMANVDPADLPVGMRVRPVFCDYPEHGVTMLRYAARPTDDYICAQTIFVCK